MSTLGLALVHSLWDHYLVQVSTSQHPAQGYSTFSPGTPGYPLAPHTSSAETPTLPLYTPHFSHSEPLTTAPIPQFLHRALFPLQAFAQAAPSVWHALPTPPYLTMFILQVSSPKHPLCPAW